MQTLKLTIIFDEHEQMIELWVSFSVVIQLKYFWGSHVMNAIGELEEKGMSPEEAAIEATLNSSNVMGNIPAGGNLYIR